MHSRPSSLITPPYRIEYYGAANEHSELDAFLYVPHDGKFREFMDENRRLLKGVFWLDADLLEAICVMEADTFTSELARRTAEILAATGLRVAVLEVLYPREILDLNRNVHHAIKPTFDPQRHAWFHDILREGHQTISALRNQLIARLAEGGRKLEIHSMRPGSIPTDMQASPIIIPTDAEVSEYNAPEQLQRYYQARQTGLLNQNDIANPRNHDLVVHHGPSREEAIMVADPELVQTTQELFQCYGIDLGLSEAYFLLSTMMSENGDTRYKKGLLIDLVKSGLSRERLGEDFNLAHLTPDPEKIGFFAQLLAAIILKTRGINCELPKPLAA